MCINRRQENAIKLGFFALLGKFDILLLMKNFYEKHLFFCTQVKDPRKKCCSLAGSCEMADYAKSRLIALGMHGPGKIRISRSGCLGRCSDGPNLLIYPDGIWYTFVNQADIDEIIISHLQNGQIVERLINNAE